VAPIGDTTLPETVEYVEDPEPPTASAVEDTTLPETVGYVEDPEPPTASAVEVALTLAVVPPAPPTDDE
jgi:hypothetical protein